MKWQFWPWLVRGLSDRPGYRLLLNRWLIIHVVLGSGMAAIVNMSIHEAAQTLLLPLAGMFIGLSFAWVGNAQALLQECEIEKLAKHHPDGIQTYVYTFQLAILVILTTLVAWGLAGLRVFSSPFFCDKWIQLGIEATLYFLASLTLRECWHVVMGSQLLILSRHKVRDANDDSCVSNH